MEDLRSTRILCDNKGALILVKTRSYSSQGKHLAIKVEVLSGWIIGERVFIDYVLTMSQLSGVLTRFLGRSIYTGLFNAIINRT